jgi:hypothetical protein
LRYMTRVGHVLRGSSLHKNDGGRDIKGEVQRDLAVLTVFGSGAVISTSDVVEADNCAILQVDTPRPKSSAPQ